MCFCILLLLCIKLASFYFAVVVVVAVVVVCIPHNLRFRVNFKKYEKTPADISASHTLEVTFKLFENKILTDSKHSKILSCTNPVDNMMVKEE